VTVGQRSEMLVRHMCVDTSSLLCLQPSLYYTERLHTHMSSFLCLHWTLQPSLSYAERLHNYVYCCFARQACCMMWVLQALSALLFNASWLPACGRFFCTLPCLRGLGQKPCNQKVRQRWSPSAFPNFQHGRAQQ